MRYPISKEKCQNCPSCQLVDHDFSFAALPDERQYYQCLSMAEESCIEAVIEPASITFCEMHKPSGCYECPNRWVCEKPPLFHGDDSPDFEDLQMTEEEELGLGRKPREDYQGENGMQADDCDQAEIATMREFPEYDEPEEDREPISEEEIVDSIHSMIEGGGLECTMLDGADARSFKDAGIMTYNQGLVIRTADGSEFQVTIIRSR